MKKSGQIFNLLERGLAFSRFPLGDPLLLHVQALGHPIQSIAALGACPREKRRIDSYGLMARHDDSDLTRNLRGCQPSGKLRQARPGEILGNGIGRVKRQPRPLIWHFQEQQKGQLLDVVNVG